MDGSWYAERKWSDAYFLTSVVTVLGALGALAARGLARWVTVALGVVAGGAAFLFEIGILILAGRLAYDDGVQRWYASVIVSAALLAAVLTAMRPTLWPLWPAPPLSLALVLAGGALLLLSHLASIGEDSFLSISRGASVIGPLATVGLAWLAVAAPGDTKSRSLLICTAVTVVLLGVLDSLPAWEPLPTAVVMVVFAGSLLILAGIATATPRSSRVPA